MVPSAPQLEVSNRVQSFLRGNIDPIVTIFGFADKLLHNLTPRVPEGEFWESTGKQDSMTLLCLEFQLTESHSQAPVEYPFTGPSFLGNALPRFRSCNPPWLRVSKKPWDPKPLRRQSLSPGQGHCLCPLLLQPDWPWADD